MKKFFSIFFLLAFLSNNICFAETSEAQIKNPEYEYYARERKSVKKLKEIEKKLEENMTEVEKPFPRNGRADDDTDKNFPRNGSEEENLQPVDEPFQNQQQTENIPQVEEGDGLEFLMYNENGVQAFAVIASHEQYKLRPVIAQNHIRGLSTLSQTSSNLNDIALINASYFAADGRLIGVTKIDGVIIGSDDFQRSAIGINSDGSTIFGRVAYEGKIFFMGQEIPINGVNCERTTNAVTIYNGVYGSRTGTNDFGIELVVENGRVTNIFKENGNNEIPVGGLIVSAHGYASEFFINANIGDPIDIAQKIISVDGEADFNSVADVIGAGPRLVKDGNIFVTADVENFPADIRVGRAPRSAVGVTQYGDYIFAVVDGRQAHSIGCTLQEWAEILRNNFGAVNAINLDGGGSTELIVKDSLVNSPSDGQERRVGSMLAILSR